jgi:tripartite-type tricarboxylate transporter receptor subunit TctC
MQELVASLTAMLHARYKPRECHDTKPVRRNTLKRLVTFLISTFATAALLVPAVAFAWPTEPVKIVVGFTPGGSSDLVARLIAPKLSAKLGGQFVVENRPGAASTLAGGLVAKAKPDGHTLFLSNVSASGIAPSTYKALGYNPVTDFEDVSILGYIPAVLLADPKLQVTNLKEFIAYVKARPGKVNFGTGGHGTMNHVAGELLNAKAGLTMEHVPYRGSAEATNDLLAGIIGFQVDALTQNVGQIKSGTVRAIAITAPERAAVAPNIPTFAELGLPDIVALNWVGISVPANTPKPIIEKLAKALAEIVKEADVRERFLAWGMTPVGSTPAEAEKFTAAEVVKWKSVVDSSAAFK